MYVLSHMDKGHEIRAFSKNIPNNWQMGRINYGVFGVFSFELSAQFCHFVSLVHDFQLINHDFYKNLSFQGIFKKYIFGFGMYMSFGCKELEI